jgi:hypothetical protein
MGPAATQPVPLHIVSIPLEPPDGVYAGPVPRDEKKRFVRQFVNPRFPQGVLIQNLTPVISNSSQSAAPAGESVLVLSNGSKADDDANVAAIRHDFSVLGTVAHPPVPPPPAPTWISMNWDVVVGAVLLLFNILAWKQVVEDDSFNSTAERSLGARVVGGAGAFGAIAAGALFAVTCVFLGRELIPSDNLQGQNDVRRALFCFLASLIFGGLLLYLIPMRIRASNVAQRQDVGIILGLELIPLLLGAAHLLIAFCF